MASKNSACLALFFALSILFFTLTDATNRGCPPSPKPKHVPTSKPKPVPGRAPIRPYFPSPSVPSPKTPIRPTTPSPSVPSPNTPIRPSIPSPSIPSPSVPSPSVPSPLVPIPSVPNPSVPIPSVPSPMVPIPSVPSPSTPGSSGNCPINALRLGACANVLSGLLNIQLGQPSAQPCCSVIQGLVDLEAAVCLCTALRANVLGINLNVPISLSLLLNACNKNNVPSDFQCA
ncbi:hypothetical protein AALP_AA6G185000 [Arabis alpina]|uniref:Bifunctional inhibitor/plant lipid transfer protein/seed storage helical domain-containing protein n=1 Tax=Arabis alpina TaxID=50452 RepID=A0A087GQ31_ARAAL|nr:hypothetical protein AALP_AA6G185000 [Arabis alpina]